MRRSPQRRRRKKTSSSIWAALGSKGGRARALKLSAKERRRIAMLGVQARLAKTKSSKSRRKRRARVRRR
jgi:hypothetical protein